MHFFVKNVTFFLLNGYFVRPRMDVAPGSSGPRKDPEKTLSEARKPRTYRVLISHLSRTYHALNFARVFVCIIYVVYNTRELA